MSAAKCRRGHEYTPENTQWRRYDGQRICRTCISIRRKKPPRTHCGKCGRGLTPENTYVYGTIRKPRRQCRACAIRRATERNREIRNQERKPTT